MARAVLVVAGGIELGEGVLVVEGEALRRALA